MQSMILNAVYDAGQEIGPILGYIFFFLMALELIYVMAKYLGPSKKTK
jgi:hypothetical protein